MRLRLSLTAVLAGAALGAALATPAAHADFTATFCTGGTGPAPWQLGAGIASPWAETLNQCAQGGAYGFDNHTGTLASGGRWAAAVQAPPDELFTHEALQFTTQATTATDAYLFFGEGAGTNIDVGFHPSDPGLTQSIDLGLADATDVWMRYECNDAGGCPLAAYPDVVAVGQMSLTVHDTAAPAIAALGGSLSANGATVAGAQTLLYHASDAGSGVVRAIASLGTTPVGESDSSCQTASLTPCPADTSGSISVNTAAVPDGSYPVILTAEDVSGNATPVQVATVTVDNHSGSTSVPHPKRRHRRAVDVHVVFHWDVQRHTTLLKSVSIGRTSRTTKLTLTCRGRHCPFTTLRAGHRSIKRLERRLRHRRFRPGQVLRFLATAPHRAAQHATMTIRRTRLPRVRAR